jgi:hypothetical protein
MPLREIRCHLERRRLWNFIQGFASRNDSHRSWCVGSLELTGHSRMAGWLRVTAAAISFPAAWSALSRRSLGDRVNAFTWNSIHIPQCRLAASKNLRSEAGASSYST